MTIAWVHVCVALAFSPARQPRLPTSPRASVAATLLWKPLVQQFRSDTRDLWRFAKKPTAGPRRPGRHAGNSYVSDLCSGLQWQSWIPLVMCQFVITIAYAQLCLPTIGLFCGVDVKTVVRTHYAVKLKRIPFATAVVVAPIAEEFTFRYGQRRAVPFWLGAPAVLFVMSFLWMMLLVMPPFSTELTAILRATGVTNPERSMIRTAKLLWSSLPRLALQVAVYSACVWNIIHRADGTARPFAMRMRTCLRALNKRYFRVIFYLYCLSFASIHLCNFNFAAVRGGVPVWFLPFLVLPQFLGGIVFGWLRVRSGIGAAVLAHSSFNGLCYLYQCVEVALKTLFT